MSIICVDLEKNKLSPWEAKRNLTEMVEKIGPEHAREVENKITEKILYELNLNYGDTLHEGEDLCKICDCDPCDCTWDS